MNTKDSGNVAPSASVGAGKSAGAQPAWVLVPREPTPQMLAAWEKESRLWFCRRDKMADLQYQVCRHRDDDICDPRVVHSCRDEETSRKRMRGFCEQESYAAMLAAAPPGAPSLMQRIVNGECGTQTIKTQPSAPAPVPNTTEAEGATLPNSFDV